MLTVQTSHAATLGELYKAFAAGDVEVATRFIAPDFVMTVPGTGGNAGVYWGPTGFRQFMLNIAAHTGGVFEITVPVFSVTGEHAFTREVIRMNRADELGGIWTLRFSNWFRMRGDQLSELYVIPEDQHLYDQFWAPVTHRPVHREKTRSSVTHNAVIDVEHATSLANYQFLGAMYEAFWRGDADAMRATFADDVVVNIVGRSDLSGEYHGWSGYMLFRERLIAMAGDKYKLDVIAMAADARNAWAVEYIRMNRRWDPEVHEIRVLMHFEMEDGRIVRMDDFPFDTARWERFYSIRPLV